MGRVLKIVGTQSGTEDVTYKSGTETEKAGNATIKVTYDTDAKIPTNAELVVTEIIDDANYLEGAEDTLGVEVIAGHFYDIHFAVDGEEIEISSAVNVTITLSNDDALSAGGNIEVIHFEDGSETPEVISNVIATGGKAESTESTGLLQSIRKVFSTQKATTADTNSVVKFTAPGFSIYGIVETKDESVRKTYRRTYTFLNDDRNAYNFTLIDNPVDVANETPTNQETNKQIVKNGGQLLDVGTPTSTVASTKKFLGWGVVTNGTVDTTSLITLPYTVSGLTGDDSVTLQAVYSSTVKIVFYDADGTTILTTVDAAPGSTLDLSTYEVVPKSSTQGFLGWSTTKDQTSGALANNYIVPGTDTSLYPVIARGVWLRFNKNDRDDDPTEATYTNPVFITTGTVSDSDRPEDPTREGYTFAGWYTTSHCTGDAYTFDGNKSITENTTLYAKWTPKVVTYKIVYWQENPDDYGFSYVESEKATGTAGSVTSTSGLASRYSGFHLHSSDKIEDDRTELTDVPDSHYEYQTEEAVIKGDGTTVVNVYYDRNVYTITFIDQDKASSSKYTQNDEGEYFYVSYGWKIYYSDENGTVLERNKYYKIDESPVVINVSKHGSVEYTYYTKDLRDNYTSHTEESKRYSSSAGSTGIIDKLTITAKYGASIGDRWPNRRTDLDETYPAKWRVNETSSWNNTYQANISTMPLNGATFYYVVESGNYTMNINYYIQNVDGDDNFVCDHTDSFKASKSDWNSTKEDYYDLRGFTPIFASEGDAAGVENYVVASNDISKEHVSDKVGSSFSNVGKNTYELNFYYARNKYAIDFTPQDGIENTDIKTSYYYEASIADAAPSTYVKGTTTRTASNGDTLTFDGWYDNPDGYGDEYNFKGKTMPANNIHLYGKWVPTTYTVTIDPNGGVFADGTTDNKVLTGVVFGTTVSEGDYDETTREGYELIGWYIQNKDDTETVYDFSTPVTSDITLIAHWRKTGSFGVKYINTDPTKTPATDGKELNLDSHVYADLADVTVLSSPTSEQIPAGYEFTGWLYNGILYKPGDTFTLDASNASASNDTITVNEKAVNYVTLKAQYTKLDTTYIRYNINYTGGSGTLTDPVGIIDNTQSNIPLNTTTTLSSGSGFTRTGYVLVGWNTQADGNGTHWALCEKVGVDDVNGNELYAEWEPVYIQLSFIKTGEQVSGTSTGLEGAGFTLSNGTESKTVTSSSDGSVSFTGENAVKAPSTAEGSITLTETTVPAGYEAIGPFTVIYDASQVSKGNDGKYYVNGTIQKDGATVNSFEDKLIRQNLVIKKIDSETRAALSGAEFTLTYGNPATNASATSGITDGKVTIGTDGTATIVGLPVGRYTLTETKAPSGYIIQTTGITIEVTKDGVTVGSIASDKNDFGQYIVTIENAPGKALPNTGGTGALPYTLGGIALLMASALMYGFVLRRRRERRLR